MHPLLVDHDDDDDGDLGGAIYTKHKTKQFIEIGLTTKIRVCVLEQMRRRTFESICVRSYIWVRLS